MIAARSAHLDAVRRVFQNSSVFVFTLGLTETWRAVADGAAFPVAPGVVSDAVAPEPYEFHNFTYAEVTADLNRFLEDLRHVNPAVRVVLTISPVPLTATYTDEHVLVATTHSKSILRAACSAAEAAFDFVYYFPSYEVISGHFNRGRYYNPNLRTVTTEGVAHVMALFRQTYCGAAPEEIPIERLRVGLSSETDADMPICDEEEIVRTVGF